MMETKFNFKSQIATSREQSEKLLALGLKKETADMMWANSMGNSSGTTYYLAVGTPYYICDIPAWSLHRLLLLYKLHHIEFMNDKEIESVYNIVINAIEWSIKEGCFNKEYLV